jgi:hypothetical protein
MGMLADREFPRCMTPGTHGVDGRRNRGAMRIVAIAARHAMAVHTALSERAIFVHLVMDLTVGEVERVIENRGPVGVSE